jgi:RHS repeat-associated protein
MPSPRAVTYGYTRGRLISIPGFVNNVVYHLNGMISQVQRANGTTDAQTLAANWLPRPDSLSTLRGGTTLWKTDTYQYDGSGNVWKMGTASFVYDRLSRVTSGTVFPGTLGTGTAHTQSYSFDLFGNIQSLTTQVGAGTPSARSTPTSTTTNRLNAAVYDAAGNMTAWSGNSFEYDGFNQMVRHISSGEDWRYIYTADDERFWSYRVGGGGSLWTLRDLGGLVARQYNAHAGWTDYRDSIFRSGTVLASADSPGTGGAVRHLHPDHLGTPRLITNSAGNPVPSGFHTYYPFGEEIAGTYNSTFTERLRFTGHERDLVNPAGQGDDLDYMHARHCSPVVGRFLSPDPFLGSSTAPQSWNHFSYAQSSPGANRNLRTDADVRLAIDRLLADPAGVYQVTPTSQGNPLYAGWP